MVKRSQQLSEGAAAVSSSIQSTATSGPKPTSHLTSSAMNNNNKPHENFKPQIQSTSTNVKRPIPVQFQNLTRGPNGKFLPRSSSNNSNSTQGGATPPPNKQPINPPPTGFNYNNSNDGGHYKQSNNNNYGGGNAPTLPSSYYPCGAPGGRMI